LAADSLAKKDNDPNRFHPERKAFRLRFNRDFQNVYKRARYFTGPDLVLYAMATDCEQRSRLGLAISKKAATAVERNRLKRILREICRLHASEFPAMGFDFILLAREGAIGKRMDDLEHSLRPLLTRFDSWRRNPTGLGTPPQRR